MKKTGIVFLPLLILLYSCTSTDDINSTITPTTQPTPTDIPLFYNNMIIRDFLDDYPNSNCSSTDLGWICVRKTSDWGKWYLMYNKTKSIEVYHSYYVDFAGITKDTIANVLSATISTIESDSYSNAADNWISEEGLYEAAYNKNKVIKHELEGMYISLFFNSSDTIMYETICFGFRCNELIISEYQHEFEYLPE